jgi:hypothetical protein
MKKSDRGGRVGRGEVGVGKSAKDQDDWMKGRVKLRRPSLVRVGKKEQKKKGPKKGQGVYKEMTIVGWTSWTRHACVWRLESDRVHSACRTGALANG